MNRCCGAVRTGDMVAILVLQIFGIFGWVEPFVDSRWRLRYKICWNPWNIIEGNWQWASIRLLASQPTISLINSIGKTSLSPSYRINLAVALFGVSSFVRNSWGSTMTLQNSIRCIWIGQTWFRSGSTSMAFHSQAWCFPSESWISSLDDRLYHALLSLRDQLCIYG